jgi:hypothetical protein
VENVENLDVGVKVKLATPDHFLLCKESLTRIGVANTRDMKLYQSCHILHRRGEYFLVHFKEMFLLDGKTANISDEDYQRRNLVAKLLEDWGLLSLQDKSILDKISALNSVKIIPFKDKKNWCLVPKYQLGTPRF